MLSSELCDLLRPIALVQRLLWWALTLPIGLYVVIAFVMGGGTVRQTPPFGAQLGAVFYALSAALAVASMVFRRRVLSEDRLRKLAAEEVDARALAVNAQTKQVDPERLQRLEALSPEERKLVRLAVSLLGPTLVSLMLHEAIGIFGLILVLVGGDPPVIFPFVTAAVALNLFVYPRPESVVRRAQGWIYLHAG
jgi:membrane protein implicated in regulation of membrane protease activity